MRKRRAQGNKSRYKGFFIVDSDLFSKGGTVAEQRGICRIRRIISDRRRRTWRTDQAIRLVENESRAARSVAPKSENRHRYPAGVTRSHRAVVGRRWRHDLQRRLFGFCRRPASRAAWIEGARGVARSRR